MRAVIFTMRLLRNVPVQLRLALLGVLGSGWVGPVAASGSASIRPGGESGRKGRDAWLRLRAPVIGLPSYTEVD